MGKRKDSFESKVLTTIKTYELIKNGDNIVIGVSGGPDSMALLNVLYNLKLECKIENIYVAHINHSLREEADEETEYVKEFCKKKDIECFVHKVDVEKLAEEQKISTELVGRNVRYKFFNEVLQKVGANKIATAHNANDNAETVLMNMIRGSAVSGLKGIEKMRDGKYIRPIIECNRKEIEEYCETNNLQPRYDKTNSENRYTRNKVRNLLIPYIEKEFNPSIVDALNRLSTLVAKEDKYFVQIVEREFENLIIDADNSSKEENVIILDLKRFNSLDEVIKSRLILYTISKLIGTSQGIEKIHIEDIIKLCGNNIGNKNLTPNKNIKIYIKKGKIFFIGQT